jgi:hypothetical protein
MAMESKYSIGETRFGKLILKIGIPAITLVFIVGGITMYLDHSPTKPETQPTVPVPTTEELRKEAEARRAQRAAWLKTPAGQICAKHPTWKQEDCDRLLKKEVWIGMNTDMLVYLFGNPRSANVSNYGRGNRYQYCWSNVTPSCFYDDNADGIIDSYN